MSIKICLNGHVLDPGKKLCSRCNQPAVDNSVEKEEELVDKPKKVSKPKKDKKKEPSKAKSKKKPANKKK